MSDAALTRRRFLISTGLTAVGLTALSACSSLIPVTPTSREPELGDGYAWVQILPGGGARFYVPRMEMGQGTPIGLAQVVAEELNIPASSIDCVSPATNQVPAFKMTVGSEGIKEFFSPVSHAAAGLREHLRHLAAKKFKTALPDITDENGGFRIKGGKTITYGDLAPRGGGIISISDGAEDVSPRRYALERRGRHKSIASASPDPALADIVTGKPLFSRDASLPGMAFGGALLPPISGATLESADAEEARKMPGVIAVAVEPAHNLAGVVAEAPHQVRAALAVLKAKWQLPEEIADDPGDRSRTFWQGDSRKFEHDLVSDGDSDGEDIGSAPVKASGQFETSFQAHAQMEPRAGLAWVREEKVEIWAGTQDPFFVQRRIAQILGRHEDDVVLHPMRMGGGFGGRILCQPAETAALLSRTSKRPVKVQWSREDEFRGNYFQPPFFHEIEAGLTKNGKISHWRHDFASAPIFFGLDIIPKIARLVIDRLADEGTARGAVAPWRAANKQIRYSDIRLPVSTGAWRGLGAAPNTFAIESMMDELAGSAGIDAVQFRIENLDPKFAPLAPVMQKAAEIAGWGRKMLPETGLGFAAAVYKDKTYVAAVAEVRIDHADRSIEVSQVWIAQDCGLVLNPGFVEQQIIGNVVWGAGLSLTEEMNFKGGAPETDNFDTYEIIRQSNVPDVHIAIVEPAGSPPVGAGEPAIAPIPAAIANGIFAASGKRPRRLPIRYDALFGAA
jgi:CO/xanthine dehydrogenase Mo-binding subunit